MQPESPDEDRRLVERFLRRREEAAFVALYRRHTGFLYALALRLAGGRAGDAEDIVQTAWIRAAEALPRFAWRSALRTWLGGIAIHCAREHLRRPEGRELPPELAAEAHPPALHRRIDLDRAVAGLPYGYREVLLLHDVEGFTHQEIAGMLEIEPGTSKSQLFHARRALKRALQPEAGPAAQRGSRR